LNGGHAQRVTGKGEHVKITMRWIYEAEGNYLGLTGQKKDNFGDRTIDTIT
jgi:hypothetical protein